MATRDTMKSLKRRIALLEYAINPILECNWTLLAGEHGTEYGDDPQFDELVDAVSHAQRVLKGYGK